MFGLFKKKDVVAGHPYREPQEPVKCGVDPRLQAALSKGQSEFEDKAGIGKQKLKEWFEVDGGFFFQLVQKAMSYGQRELTIMNDETPVVMGVKGKDKADLACSYVNTIAGLKCKVKRSSYDGQTIYYLEVKW